MLGVMGVRLCVNRKPTHDFPIPLNAKFCSIYAESFGRHANVKLCPTIRPHLWGLRCTYGIEKDANRNVIPTFIFDFCTQHRPISHRFATIHNAADRRQAERSE